MEPLFSVIIPVLNAEGKLEKTLDSIAGQEFPNLEVLVMDGGADAGTEATVNRTRLPNRGSLRYVGEADKGVYDAMNKALDLARGRYVYFAGAGDSLRPGALASVQKKLPPDCTSLVYGNVLRGAEVYDGPFDRWRLCHRNICHQAAFYGREVFTLVGKFSLAYPACSDWEFNMRCFAEARVAKCYIDTVVADFEKGGLSSRGDAAFNQDHWRLIARHLGWLPMVRWALAVQKAKAMETLRRE